MTFHRQLRTLYQEQCFKNTYFKELLSTDFHWLPGFSNKTTQNVALLLKVNMF